MSETASDQAHDSDETATTDHEPDVEAIEKDRQERLDPDNRPDNAQVDNTDRDFDIAKGQFTDSEDDPDIGPFNDPTSEDGEMEA